MNSQNTEALPIKAQGGERLGPANGSAHPWRNQISAAQKIAAAKREGAKLRAKKRAQEMSQDPIYRQATTQRHVAWESKKWATDQEWKAARKQYYKTKRQKSAPNAAMSDCAGGNRES